MLKHYVEFTFLNQPVSVIFTEHTIVEVAERNDALVVIPYGAYCYRFFDRTEIVVNGELLKGENKNFSPMTYFCAEEYSLNEAKDLYPAQKEIFSDMEELGYTRVVKTCRGNWKPLENGDVVT